MLRRPPVAVAEAQPPVARRLTWARQPHPAAVAVDAAPAAMPQRKAAAVVADAVPAAMRRQHRRAAAAAARAAAPQRKPAAAVARLRAVGQQRVVVAA